MKLIIKNDSKETVKNPNVKIIETTEASFINQTVFIEENDVPIIKFTDTESMYFVKDLDNLYDRKSRSEVLLDITIDNLELIGSGSSEPVDPRPYKVYTALLTQSGTNAPVDTVLENTIGDITWFYTSPGRYSIVSDRFIPGKVFVNIPSHMSNDDTLLATYKVQYLENLTLESWQFESTGGSMNNWLLFNTPIEIRVYN